MAAADLLTERELTQARYAFHLFCKEGSDGEQVLPREALVDVCMALGQHPMASELDLMATANAFGTEGASEEGLDFQSFVGAYAQWLKQEDFTLRDVALVFYRLLEEEPPERFRRADALEDAGDDEEEAKAKDADADGEDEEERKKREEEENKKKKKKKKKSRKAMEAERLKEKPVFLEAKRLARLLDTIGESVSLQDAENVIAEFDRGGDGQIELDDFVRMVLNT